MSESEWLLLCLRTEVPNADKWIFWSNPENCTDVCSFCCERKSSNEWKQLLLKAGTEPGAMSAGAARFQRLGIFICLLFYVWKKEEKENGSIQSQQRAAVKTPQLTCGGRILAWTADLSRGKAKHLNRWVFTLTEKNIETWKWIQMQ